MDRQKQNDYMYRLAERNEAEQDAKLCEPRVLFDNFYFDGTVQRVAQPTQSVFRNGERFPYRITHLLMQMAYEADDGQSPVGGDEREVQRYGLRVKSHGTYYQNFQFTPLPLFANKPIAASDVATSAQATWRFDQPFVIGNRDTFSVDVQLLVAPGSGSDRVTVSFQGVGLYSRQPKILTGTLEISDVSKHTIDVNSYRNDGTEPMEIHTCIAHHAPPSTTQNPVGNIRNVRIQIQANGNGTNQRWIIGPSALAPGAPAALDLSNGLMPAPLFGTAAGRAIVHRLPGKGWLWYPGEGVFTEMQSYDTSREEMVLLAMLGYVIVL